MEVCMDVCMELDWRYFDKQLASVHAIMTCQAPLMSSVGSLVILPSATIGRGMHVHIDRQHVRNGTHALHLWVDFVGKVWASKYRGGAYIWWRFTMHTVATA